MNISHYLLYERLSKYSKVEIILGDETNLHQSYCRSYLKKHKENKRISKKQ